MLRLTWRIGDGIASYRSSGVLAIQLSLAESTNASGEIVHHPLASRVVWGRAESALQTLKVSP
jgi:hypothetical protein